MFDFLPLTEEYVSLKVSSSKGYDIFLRGAEKVCVLIHLDIQDTQVYYIPYSQKYWWELLMIWQLDPKSPLEKYWRVKI